MSSTPVFSFEQMNMLYNACPSTTIKNQTVRTLTDDVKKYLHTYFFQTVNNNYLFYDAKKDVFNTFNRTDIIELYFSRFGQELKNYFFHQNYCLFRTVIHPTQPKVYADEINLFPGVLHSVKPYEDYTDTQKQGVELFLSYMKEVLASGNEDEFSYLLKWTAKMTQGQKNDSVLYLKGIEGIGKSTFSDFLFHYVIGKKASTLSDAEPLLTANNKELCGKLLVIFEELPTFSDKAWEGVSSKLKKAVTSDMEKYADKYEKRFECENLNNYIINTNVEALKHSEGRRFFLVNVSTHRKGDHDYFGNIKTQCYNKQVGEAFYSYLHTIDISGFNSQRDMPETSNKLDAIADRLDYVYRFIKERFIFKNQEINHTVKELFEMYELYMKHHDKKPCLKTHFCKKMRDVNFNYYASLGVNKYHIKLSKLKETAKNNKWIHTLDDYKDNEVVSPPEELTYQDLQTENKELKLRIKELEKQMKINMLVGESETTNITINNYTTIEDDDIEDDNFPGIPQYNYFADRKVQPSKKAQPQQTQQKAKKSKNVKNKTMEQIADALLK